MENTKYGKRREERWTPIRAKAQDARANPNSWETHLMRKRWDIGLLRALSLRIMMMRMPLVKQTIERYKTRYNTDKLKSTPYWLYTILSIQLCPYYFVRYQFVIEHTAVFFVTVKTLLLCWLLSLSSFFRLRCRNER